LLYVNARDEKCDENFVWCDKQEVIRAVGGEYPWELFEPNDYIGNENCVVMRTDGFSVSIADWICNSKKKFICEVNILSNNIGRFKIQFLFILERRDLRCKEVRLFPL